jgi:hypothetical protein
MSLPPTFRRRLVFWGEAMSVGVRWAWGLLDGLSRAIAVGILIAAVALPSFLTDRPAWESALIAGVLLLVMFAEGAYRVWQEADIREPAHPDRQTDATAVWLSEQLSAGNELLARWHAGTPSYNATEQIQGAAEWEHETQARLAERLPEYAGHFGLEVGFGREFAQYAFEPHQRVRLRRRIHSLKGIADRYEQKRGT